jgi:hypothetical protein
MLDPESYTYASVDLDADVELDVALFPDAGRVILLALATRNRSTAPAEPTTVTVIPKHGSTGGCCADRHGCPLDREPRSARVPR